jgi:FkbM family methyltransferase
MQEMAAEIDADLKRGVIAQWHDESHWNAYLAKEPPQVSLPPPYCWGEPEGCPPGTRILALAKDHAAYRQGGADPRDLLPTLAPDAIPTVQEMTRALRQSRIQEPMLGRITTALEQIRAVQERVAPRVCQDGPQGDLENVLLDLLPSGPVLYVDVGAAEPVDCSNTWPLYTLGGRGLLIEPRPSCWPSLLRQRPRDHLWPTAVARQEGFAELVECGGCSSIEPAWTREVRGRMMVPTMRLRDILDQFPEIRRTAQLCSIDVEGAEEQVIESADWQTFRPLVVVVEHMVFEHPERNSHRANEIAGLMGERDYEMVHRDDLNLVFRRIP